MTTIIAEIGINHNGNVSIAKQLMDMAKECGADLVKFQKRSVNVVYSTAELDKPRESPWGTTTREQKWGLEFGKSQYDEINRYSQEIAFPWTASAWDLGSLQFLDQYALPCHKIASAMIANLQFVEEVAGRGKLTYVSTGMLPDLCTVTKAVNIFRYYDCPLVLMHCVGEYPCHPQDSNLSMIKVLQREYPEIQVGFSSHAVSPIVGAFSVLLGAVAVEAHITIDRSMYGSDQSASLEKSGLEKLVDYCRMAEQVKGSGIKIMTAGEIKNAAKLRYWESSNG
jgi:N-acetylneuraminate synthase